MGQVTSDQRAPYVERFSLALLLPRYLLMAPIILMGGFGLVIMGALGLMHYADLPSNPFAAYADVFPGQPIRALSAHEPSCWHDYYLDVSETRCNLSPKSGVFSEVAVIYANDLIHHISFTMRDNTFKIGDLAVLLGVSEFHAHGSVLFLWRGNVGLAQVVKPSAHFSVLRRVWQVTLTDTRLIKP